MSLDYNLTAVPDANWQDEKGNMSAMAYCMIHSLDHVRIRTVTADNIATIIVRQREFNEVSPPRGWSLNGVENYLFTVDDVRRFIGLTTNVTPASDEAWTKYIRLQRVYTLLRANNKNEVPDNNTHLGYRRFSLRSLASPKLHRELLAIGGTIEKVPDELMVNRDVFIIENYH